MKVMLIVQMTKNSIDCNLFIDNQFVGISHDLVICHRNRTRTEDL